MANIITNKQLVECVNYMLGHEYWYGASGEPSTESLLKTLSKRYPKYYNPANYKVGWTCDGREVADCSGNIKNALFRNGDPKGKWKYCAEQDLSANTMIEKAATESGPISTIPEIPGILVWKEGHVGTYVGNGIVTEERGHNYGCVQTKLSQRGWQKWFKLKWIKYEEKKNTINVTCIVDGKTYNGNIEEV